MVRLFSCSDMFSYKCITLNVVAYHVIATYDLSYISMNRYSKAYKYKTSSFIW